MILTTEPREVCVSAKYVTADFDDSNSGTLSITVAVEGGCCPAICRSTPTPHKPAAGCILEDWVQKRINLDKVLPIEVFKDARCTKDS